MSKLVLRTAAVAALLLATQPFAPLAAAQSVTAVPQLDLNRFMGTWYEVAR
jgi:lipocalin